MSENKYVLYLNENGDGFSALVRGKDIYQAALNIKLNENQVLGTSSRDEGERTESADIIMKNGQFYYEYGFYDVISFGYYVLSNDKVYLNVPKNDVPIAIQKALACQDRTQVKIFLDENNLKVIAPNMSLYHHHFQERASSGNFLEYHNNIKGGAHPESQTQFATFVTEREHFYTNNFNQGFEYEKRPFYKLSWVAQCLNYYCSKLANQFAMTLCGLLLGVEASHYCEDFDAGYKAAKAGQRKHSFFNTEKDSGSTAPNNSGIKGVGPDSPSVTQ
jgi:hypothetical protein